MKRLSQLDGIRGIAILLVLVFHYVWSQAQGVLPGPLRGLLMWSYCGVDLFFVLSGFLITGILLDNVGAENLLKVFYVRRACRILPLYIVAVLAFVVGRQFLEDDWRFMWLFKDPLPLWNYLTLTQNFAMAAANTSGPHWLDVTWSLAIEEHFYLLLPLIVCLTPRRSLPWVFGAMIITAPLLRWFVPLNELNCYVSSPWRADSIVSGALLAWCVRQPIILEHMQAHARQFYWVLAALPLLLFGITWQGLSRNGAFEHLIFALFFSTLILIAFVDERSVITKALRWRPLVLMGLLSYGVYLFHEPVSGLLHGFLRASPPRLESVASCLVTFAALVLTFVLAAISYYFFERRIIAFGHRFRYARESEPATLPPLQPVPVAVQIRP